MLQKVESSSGINGVGALCQDMKEGLHEQAACLLSDFTLSRKEIRELQERLMVSEAMVQAQAEQLKDFRELLGEFICKEEAI